MYPWAGAGFANPLPKWADVLIIGGALFAFYHFAQNAKSNGAIVGPGSTGGTPPQSNQQIATTYIDSAATFASQYGQFTIGGPNQAVGSLNTNGTGI